MLTRPVPWPGGAKVAVAITFDMDADSLVHIEHPGESITRISTISMLKYGPEVGVPRILDGYRRYGLKQTFFIPAWCIEHYPRTVEAIVEGGHEIGFHGYIHEAPNSLSRDEERYWMQRSIAVIEKHTGRRPRGNRSPLYNFSINTADLLVEEGFTYDSSLMGDDVPYVLDTGKGEIVELPSSWALDDWPPYVHSIDLDYMFQIVSPDRAMETFMAEFEAMRTVGGGLWIGVWHPFVSGRLSRWLRIEKMIEYMLGTGDVWFAPLEEIAAHIQTMRKQGAYEARVDKLPYYDKLQVPSPPPSPMLKKGR
ncbi:MAG: polysaccharide deacetylase [Pseudomonadota bacterium]|nr:polysaccharide deacetylase [Pseudomonadota bacterium]